MLTIAGGIVIAFFAIRFLLNWGDKSQVRQIEAWNSRYERERAEKERLRLLAIRLRETNPQLYAQADARVPSRAGTAALGPTARSS